MDVFRTGEIVPLRHLESGVLPEGLFNLLQCNQEEIKRWAGRGMEVTMVSRRNLAEAQALVGDRAQVANARAIVLELTGGTTLAKELAS